jgi:hypothetical protein
MGHQALLGPQVMGMPSIQPGQGILSGETGYDE